MLKNFLLAGAAVGALAAAAVPARAADNITTNTWYTGHFTATGTALLGNSGIPALNTTGPILPNPTIQPTALAAPYTNGVLTAIVTLVHGGTLLVTDVQTSGDQFQIFVNGNPAAIAPAGATGIVPGGQQSYNGADVKSNDLDGLTSLPLSTTDNSCGIDIKCALADANYSSGTFYLPAGTDTITGKFLGTIANGDMDLIVETPEPDTLSVLGLGLAGLGLIRRRRRRT